MCSSDLKYLARWGFTPQKPIRRAYEQSPAAVQAWLEGEYPGIAERARQEGAEIHWGDETAVVNTDVRGQGCFSRNCITHNNLNFILY